MKIRLARCRICGSITHRVAHDRVHCPTCKKDRRFVGDPEAPVIFAVKGYTMTKQVTAQWTRFVVDDGAGQLLIVERSMVNPDVYNVTDTRNYKAGCRSMDLDGVNAVIDAWVPPDVKTVMTQTVLPFVRTTR